MELRQRQSSYTLMSESHSGPCQLYLPAGTGRNTLRHPDDLFAGLLQHSAVSVSLRQLLLPVTRQSAAIYSRLFPESPCPENNCSLTLYDRLNVALTVAQLSDISMLCDFYANHLRPLAGPSGTKENNNRLTEITQYARQLACFPETACAPAISRLQNVGLTASDILTLHHICGFISWQSRMMTGIMALSGIKLPAFFMFTSAPVFPDLLSDTVAPQKLPPVEFNLLREPALEILREVQTLSHPDFVPLVIAHAPAPAQAWLCLRSISPGSLSEAQSRELELAVDLPANTVSDHSISGSVSHLIRQLLQMPARDCFTETERLNRNGWKSEAILQLLFVVASSGWDRALTPLS
ncbi:hypothetical protein [Tatumella sp. UBA2305]|uniref:hypothetical protein n=1 Tax=Tatumella sp. UBA2305 TaxID=1947647 RepID=UPI0025DD3CD7|nr:hypothetical protein [Tatumella sp. UBA2305]